jgi:hypothetical protein
LSFKGLRHVASLPSHGQRPKNGEYGFPREQSQAAPLFAEFAYSPLLVRNGAAFLEPASTRGLRTIEKRGVDVVVADLRAKGVKV